MSAGGMIPGAIDAREHDLLERLGLDERATPEDVARTRDELQAFLAAAPKSIRGWARRQASAADEAYVLLSDPTAWRDPGALPESPARSASQPDGPATPPVRRATPAVAPAAAAITASEGDDDAEFEAMLAEVTPSMHRDRIAPRPAVAKPAAQVATKVPAAATRRKVGLATPAAPRRFPRVLAVLAGIAVLAVGVVAVYQFGTAPAATGAQSTPAPTAGLDQDKVAALMTRIQADPNDADALLELGDAFFQAQDFATAAGWLDKLVTLEPNNVRGRLALGAAQFNLGKNAEAEAQWLAVLELDKDNVEAHYDLGFLYLNEVPPDYEGVQREWAEVVRLAPGTEIATVVQQHLDALAAQSPAPSSGASPAPTADASAAPTAVPTAAPSATVTP